MKIHINIIPGLYMIGNTSLDSKRYGELLTSYKEQHGGEEEHES